MPMQMRPTPDWRRPGEPDAPPLGDPDDLVALLARGDVVVLSGAGLSTESGIPDYRGETGRLRRANPMTYQEFTGGEAARRRYWARSHVGWRAVTGARPNAGHAAVEALRRGGFVGGVITQNVDGLHRAAGTADAVELHGALDRVRCLECGRISRRERLDERLHAANGRLDAAELLVNPDGDAEIPDELVAGFRVVGCEVCGGVLKPDVVFFGENVPRERVERCYRMVDAARGVLVLGSSLTVMSGLRFARRAAAAGTPVGVVNRGPTRGDALAGFRLDLPLGATLTAAAARLGARSGDSG